MLDVLLEVCRAFPAYTVDAVLDLPVRRFWYIVDNVRARRQEQARAAGRNPLVALGLMGER